MSGEPAESFYICVYLKNGEPVGHRGSHDRKFPDNLHTDEDSEKPNPKIKRSGFDDISGQFISAMMGYLEYVPLILNLAPMISQQMVTHSLQTFLEANCKSRDRTETRIIYEFGKQNFAAIRRFQENLDAAASTSRSLPRLLTVGLVASLEYHLNLIMKEIAARNPEAIFGRDKMLPVREAVKFDSMEELKEFVINDEIDKAQRENFESQVSWIVSKSNMDDFTPNYPDWPNILELFERRNLFVHANGVVNDSYLKAGAKEKFPNMKDRALGDELHAGPEYFISSVHQVIHFGAMMLQVVWRKVVTDETELADKAVGDIGYELIVRGQYALAIRILEFARNLRNVSGDARKRMNVINLANAYKLSKDDAASLKVLSSMDWTAAATEFKISVAAVKGNVEEVIELMKRIGWQGDVDAHEYQEWPVFYGVREDQRFTNAFKSVFGVEYVPSAKKQAGLAQVMEWIKEQKLEVDPGTTEIALGTLSLQSVGT